MGDYKGCIIADLKPALGVSSDDITAAKLARFHAWPETEANGKLIAAAPALLTALEEARAEIIELADGLGCDHDANICKCSTRELVHRLDSALALATGKEG